jgi:hypothetical protein
LSSKKPGAVDASRLSLSLGLFGRPDNLQLRRDSTRDKGVLFLDFGALILNFIQPKCEGPRQWRAWEAPPAQHGLLRFQNQ